MDFNLHRLEALLTQEGFPFNNPQEKRLTNQTSSLFKLHGFETVASTNETLWQLIEQGADEGTVVLALQQHAGRGQWGREWRSPPGGLYLSLALTPNLPAEISRQLTLCTCWGIATALRAYEIPVSLKWPNDLVAQGRKLGGILLETRLRQGRIHRAIAGVGINWRNPVPSTGITVQTLMMERSQPTIDSLEMLAAIVLAGLMKGYRDWQNQGIDFLLPSYQDLLINLGQPINVNGNSGVITGVSATGELVVRVDLDNRASTTKDVFLQPGEVSLGYVSSGTESCS
ncbi:MAG TPA: biotin--[acetyl-CoA-carboxylase] ligase [Crinalium sp.]